MQHISWPQGLLINMPGYQRGNEGVVVPFLIGEQKIAPLYVRITNLLFGKGREFILNRLDPGVTGNI